MVRSAIRITLIFLIGLFVFTACIHYRKTTDRFYQDYPEMRSIDFEYKDRNLSYISINRNDSFPTLFFLHGAPSSLNVFNVYYRDENLAQWANIISADRPGYGFSNPGRAERSIKKQAEKMWKILENEDYPRPLYIIGASYGGSVAARMAMMHPDKVDGLFFISASLAPGLETTYPISYIVRFPPFRWLLPSMITVANDEKLSHFDALSEMLPYWDRITAPVIFIQGQEDDLIFPENVDFAKKQLVNVPYVETHMIEGEGHFLQLKYKDFILERLRNLIEMTQIEENQEAIDISIN
ncbi:MAG: alpha/beta hydrolase [Bacteroidetes bacterium]|nr:alpha/beta hydrolase [Bacteroidota bacterium]